MTMMTNSRPTKECVRCGSEFSGPLSRCKVCRDARIRQMPRLGGSEVPCRRHGETACEGCAAAGEADSVPPAPKAAIPVPPAPVAAPKGPSAEDRILLAISSLAADVRRLESTIAGLGKRLDTVERNGRENLRAVDDTRAIKAALAHLVSNLPSLAVPPEGRQASPGAAGTNPAAPKGPPPAEDPASRLGVESSRQIELD